MTRLFFLTLLPPMTDRWTNEAWEDAIRAVFRRALTDPHYRELALKNPNEAFVQTTGRTPPANVRFVDALEEHVLVLPKVVLAPGELSEIDVSRILYHSFRQQSIPPAIHSEPC